MKYVHRLSADRLHSLLKPFPAVLLVGPRQCGKSTPARERQILYANIEIIPWNDVASGRIELF